MRVEKEKSAISSMLLVSILFLLAVAGIRFYMQVGTKLAVTINRLSEQSNTDHMPVSATADTKIKRVALTFDDGPNPEYTEELLDGLKERDVRASFFLLGQEVELYPDIVKRISEEGHLIGTHSFQHVNLNLLTVEAAAAQISMTNQEIYEVTGTYPEYVRPPYGSWKEELDDRFSMVEVLWDIDTMDWSVLNTDKVVNTVQKQVTDGSVILMHDAYPTSVEAALKIIDLLEKEHYEFVTVDALILE